MKKCKIKFSHFERYSLNKNYNHNKKDGVITKSIQIYAGSILSEEFDDMELELTINDKGNIDITLLNTHYYNPDEIKWLNDALKYVDWEGYEFFHFSDVRDQSIKCKDGFERVPYEYILIGDKNSELFDVVCSPKNLDNINKLAKKLK